MLGAAEAKVKFMKAICHSLAVWSIVKEYNLDINMSDKPANWTWRDWIDMMRKAKMVMYEK